MTLVRFLAEVRVREGTTIPDDLDPIGRHPRARIGMNQTRLNRVLAKACLAVIATAGNFSDSDVFALGRDARGLFDTFAVEWLRARCRQQDFEMIVGRLLAQ